MSNEDSLSEILKQLEAGDQQAAAQIVQRYSIRLIRLAGTRMNPRDRCGTC